MKWFLITSIAVCFMCSLNVCTKVQRAKHGGRIVGGTKADGLQYPYIVEININKGLNKTYSRTGICTGAILSPKLVLTAAHCTILNNKFVDPQHITVLAGAQTSHKGGKTFQKILAHKIVSHPKFKAGPLNPENDVAILILEASLDYNELVNEIALGHSMSNWNRIIKDKDTQCVILGFGKTQGNATTGSDVLMVAPTTPFSSEACKKFFCEPHHVKEYGPAKCKKDMSGLGEVCAKRSDTATCKGDSGGPLVCNNRVWGVLSYGEPPCPVNSPDVFANLRLIKEVWDHLWNNSIYAELANYPQYKRDRWASGRDLSFLAKIEISSPTTDVHGHIPTQLCTGAVIKANLILSACHCFARQDGQGFVQGWQVNVTAGNEQLQTLKVVPHPSCSPLSYGIKGKFVYENDVAFLVLNQRLSLYPSGRVKTIPLGAADGLDTLKVLKAVEIINAECHVYGLGMQKPSEDFREFDISMGAIFLMTDTSCRKRFSDVPRGNYSKKMYTELTTKNFLEEGMMCGLTDDRYSCFGHTGGPVVCNGRVFGVDSYSLKCGKPTRCRPNESCLNWPSVFFNYLPIKQLYAIIQEDKDLAQLVFGKDVAE